MEKIFGIVLSVFISRKLTLLNKKDKLSSLISLTVLEGMLEKYGVFEGTELREKIYYHETINMRLFIEVNLQNMCAKQFFVYIKVLCEIT